MNKPLGVAICGLGIGEQHARAFHALPTCRLRWLYDLDRSRANGVVQKLEAGAVAQDFETVVTSPEIQIVSIASYDDVHYEQVVRSLRAGKHVFVEKPLCRSVDELRCVKQTWQASECFHLASNLVLRAAPLYVWLKEAVQAGEFGDIYAFDGDYLYGRLEKITQGWRRNVSKYSVMLGGGVHLVDLMLGITGQKPASATAIGNRICTSSTSFQYNDFVAATYEFASGLVGRITSNYGCVHRHQHAVRLFGTRKTFIYDDQGPRVHDTRDPLASQQKLDLSPLPRSKGDLIPGFVRGIVERKGCHAESQREFDLISVCVAADRAIASRGPVEIEYV